MTEEVAWQFNKPAIERYHGMFNEQRFTDVTFSFPAKTTADTRRYKCAHKSILASASEVFATMFYGPTPQKDPVEIEDIPYETFVDMLRYIYTDELDITGKNILQLRYSADKYLLQTLFTKCNEFIDLHMDSNSVCDIWQQAVLIEDNNDLVNKCMGIISKETKKVFESEGFMNLSHLALSALLDFDELTASEVEIFDAAVSWARNQCRPNPTVEDLRNKLGEAVYKIRFPVMSFQEFANCLSRCKLVTDEEGMMITMCYNTIALNNQQLGMKFPLIPRKGACFTVIRDDLELIATEQSPTNQTVSITNSSSFPIEVKGFYVLKIDDLDFHLYARKKSLFGFGAEPTFEEVSIRADSTRPYNDNIRLEFMALAVTQRLLQKETVTYNYLYKPPDQSQYMGTIASFNGTSFSLKEGSIEVFVKCNCSIVNSTAPVAFGAAQPRNVNHCHVGGIVCKK